MKRPLLLGIAALAVGSAAFLALAQDKLAPAPVLPPPPRLVPVPSPQAETPAPVSAANLPAPATPVPAVGPPNVSPPKDLIERAAPAAADESPFLAQAREEVRQAEADALRLRQAEIRLRFARERLKLAEAENQARLSLARQASGVADPGPSRQYPPQTVVFQEPAGLEVRISSLEKKLEQVVRELQGLKKEMKPAAPPVPPTKSTE
jgi:hypothetical protein